MPPRIQQAVKSNKSTATNTPKKVNMWTRALRCVVMLLSVSVVITLTVSGYAGNVSPLQHGGMWGIFPLAFPLALLAAVLMLIVDILVYRRAALIVLVGLLAAGGPILSFFPLNISSPKAPEGAERFKILTYNVLNLQPQNGDTITPNPMLQYVIASDADIVCLQEAVPIVPKASLGITREQADMLHSRYPYIIIGGAGSQAILSKYPTEVIHLDVNKNTFPSGDLAAFRLTLPSGKLISVFNVHLHSFSLTETDRELYRNLTDLKKENIHEVKNQLWNKLSDAAVGRAREVQQMMRWLRQYGGPDVIVCGDFNDVADCYAIRTLADTGFRSVYPAIGFGPMITYNANRFYFCIDHVLYRGSLQALNISKGRLRASDHYPLTVEFAVR